MYMAYSITANNRNFIEETFYNTLILHVSVIVPEADYNFNMDGINSISTRTLNTLGLSSTSE